MNIRRKTAGLRRLRLRFFFVLVDQGSASVARRVRVVADLFWQTVQASFPTVTTLLINLDNGPENHSRRTQFIQRLVTWVDARHLTLHLAYYPPYHSKYNPIERVWGVLEQHWNGSLLESRQTVLRLASTMTYKGVSPIVKFIDHTYQTGIRLSQQAMSVLERRLDRLPLLGKWFVRIVPLC